MNIFTTLFLFFFIFWTCISAASEIDPNTILLKNINQEKISNAIELIKSILKKNTKDFGKNPVYELDNHIKWYSGQVPKLLLETFNHFQQNNKIYSLTDQIKEKLQSDSKYCSNLNNQTICYKMEAFYIPTFDAIFIDDNLPSQKFTSLLFHELIHAYQYRYSFPLDIEFLIEQNRKTQNTISPNELLNILIFRYEAQANWYQATLFQTKEWYNLESTFNQAIEGIVKLYITLFSKLFTLGLIDFEEKQIIEAYELMPKDFIYNTTRVRFDSNPAFSIPELILFNDSYIQLLSNIDISIHKRFYNLLGRAYFGELPFIVDKRIQKIYRGLLGNYYENLVNKNWANNPDYQNLLKRINEQDISPFMKWLTLDDTYFDNTPAFQGFLHNRAEIIDLLMKNPSGFFQFDARSAVINTGSNQSQEQTVINGSNNKSKSLASSILSTPSSTNNQKISKKDLNKALATFILQGGEGSTPGLDFALPEIPIFIQPQLEFTKESIEQDFEPESKPSHFESVREER